MTGLEDLIEKYVDPFDDTEQARRVIREMISRGYRPSSASATLFYILNDGVTQAEAADRFDSSAVSIRKHMERVEELIKNGNYSES